MNLEKGINTANLIYKYQTEGKSPRDFNNYQNFIDLFINLRDGNLSPREGLKNQRKSKIKIKRSNEYNTKC